MSREKDLLLAPTHTHWENVKCRKTQLRTRDSSTIMRAGQIPWVPHWGSRRGEATRQLASSKGELSKCCSAPNGASPGLSGASGRKPAEGAAPLFPFPWLATQLLWTAPVRRLFIARDGLKSAKRVTSQAANQRSCDSAHGPPYAIAAT